MIQEKEVQSLRRLAARWMEHAANPVMAERRRQWKAVKDLAAEKPMILVETCMLPDYIGRDELVCVDPFVRNIEKSLYEIVRHADEIGDDIVVDPCFRIPWVLEISDYGVPIEKHHATTSNGSDLGYSFNFGVQSEKDAQKLHLRSRCVNRRESFHQKELLEDIFGDILPVRLGGYDHFDPDPGYRPWLGNLYGGLTMDLFKLIGNDNLLTWVYDNPPPHSHASWRSSATTGRRISSSWRRRACCTRTRTPGCRARAATGSSRTSRRRTATGRRCVCRTAGAGPSRRRARRSRRRCSRSSSSRTSRRSTRPFGLTYYGCCEGVHDRFELIEKAIPNLRAVSVSGWSDLFRMGELLGKKYVYSQKADTRLHQRRPPRTGNC